MVGRDRIPFTTAPGLTISGKMGDVSQEGRSLLLRASRGLPQGVSLGYREGEPEGNTWAGRFGEKIRGGTYVRT